MPNPAKENYEICRENIEMQSTIYIFIQQTAVSVFNIISAGSSQQFGSPCRKTQKMLKAKLYQYFRKNRQIQMRKPMNFVEKP